MKFGNPISDVNATITGGQVSLASGSTIGIVGKQVTGLVIPTNSILGGPYQTGSNIVTTQLLSNSTGTDQYVLVSLSLSDTTSPSSTNTELVQLQATGTSTMNIYYNTWASPPVRDQNVSLQNIILPIGAGISITYQITNKLKVLLYYTIINATNPYIPGLGVQSNA